MRNVCQTLSDQVLQNLLIALLHLLFCHFRCSDPGFRVQAYHQVGCGHARHMWLRCVLPPASNYCCQISGSKDPRIYNHHSVAVLQFYLKITDCFTSASAILQVLLRVHSVVAVDRHCRQSGIVLRRDWICILKAVGVSGGLSGSSLGSCRAQGPLTAAILSGPPRFDSINRLFNKKSRGHDKTLSGGTRVHFHSSTKSSYIQLPTPKPPSKCTNTKHNHVEFDVLTWHV